MRYVLLCGMVLGLAACGVNPPIAGRQDPYMRQQINFASPDLANKTAVGVPILERKDGILHVTVPIRSASDYDLLVDAQVTFFNPQGAPIYTSSWEHQPMLVRNTQQFLHFNSTSGDAANFQVNLRYAE